MRLIDRRRILQGVSATALLPLGVRFAATEPASTGLLQSARIANYPYPALSSAVIGGGVVTYAIQGPEDGQRILYFHGWGDDYRVVLPLEYAALRPAQTLVIAAGF